MWTELTEGRTDDAKSFFPPTTSGIIRNRIGPKTDPLGTPGDTGTGSEAWLSINTCLVRPESHELIQCRWTLLSHNSQIYEIASCVAPYQRPLRNHELLLRLQYL